MFEPSTELIELTKEVIGKDGVNDLNEKDALEFIAEMSILIEYAVDICNRKNELINSEKPITLEDRDVNAQNGRKAKENALDFGRNIEIAGSIKNELYKMDEAQLHTQ